MRRPWHSILQVSTSIPSTRLYLPCETLKTHENYYAHAAKPICFWMSTCKPKYSQSRNNYKVIQVHSLSKPHTGRWCMTAYDKTVALEYVTFNDVFLRGKTNQLNVKREATNTPRIGNIVKVGFNAPGRRQPAAECKLAEKVIPVVKFLPSSQPQTTATRLTSPTTSFDPCHAQLVAYPSIHPPINPSIDL